MFYDIDIYNIAIYADGNTPYTSDFNLEEVIQKLELTTNSLFEWFKNNHMKANADKFHLLVTRDTDVTTKIGELDVKNSREEKLLGVKTDSKLSFENHISSLCKKARNMLHALRRVVHFIDLAIMQLVWRPTYPTIHETKQFHLSNVPFVWQAKSCSRWSSLIINMIW